MPAFRIEGQIYEAANPDEAYRKHAEATAPGVGSGMLAQFNQGLTLGAADEMQAAIEAATGGGYDDSMRRQQSARTKFAIKHPYLSAGATAVGSVAPVVASMFLAPETGGAAPAAAIGRTGQMIRNAFTGEALPAATTTGQAMAQGAKYGTAFGGLGGYFSADPDSSGGRLMGGLEGGGGGALLGAKIPAVMALVDKARGAAQPLLAKTIEQFNRQPPSSIVDPAAPIPMGQRVLDAIQPPPSGSSAEAKILQSLRAAGISPETAAGALKTARQQGVPLFLMDVGGQPTLRLARGTRTLPGEGSAMIDTALENRAQAQPGRVKRYLEKALGRRMTGNSGAMSDALLNEARSESSPFYKKLRSLPEINDGNVDEIFGYPAVRNIIQNLERNRAAWGQTVNPLYDEAGNLLRKPLFSDVNDLNVTVNQMMAPSYERMGGRPIEGVNLAIQEGRNMANAVRGRLVSAADQAPGGDVFATASSSYAGPAAARTQYERGLDFNKPATTLEDVIAQGRDTTPAQQKWYQRGQVEALRSKIDSMPDLGQKPNVLRSFYGNPEARAKLDASVNPRRLQNMQQRLELENQAAQNNNFVRGGSQTADKAAEAADVALDVAAGATQPEKAAKNLLGKAWNAVMSKVGQENRAEVARLLTEVNPEKQAQIMNRLIELDRAGRLRASEVGNVVRSMTIENQTE